LAARKKSDEQMVRIAPLGELRAYTISEHELEQLEQGAPVSDLLTIGLCLLSAALTVLATLLSTPLLQFTFTLFFCALLICGLGGGICTYLGWRMRTSTTKLVQQMRARMSDAPPIQQAAPQQPTGPPPIQSSPSPPAAGPPAPQADQE
jgi:hypothetical protein